jgi:hypothetical protein
MSKMLVADEVKRELSWTTMTYYDFLEALCRISELKSFPTDDEIVSFGHKNVVDFFKTKKTMMEWEGDQSQEDAADMFEDHGRPLHERLEKFFHCLMAYIDHNYAPNDVGTSNEKSRIDFGTLIQTINSWVGH